MVCSLSTPEFISYPFIKNKIECSYFLNMTKKKPQNGNVKWFDQNSDSFTKKSWTKKLQKGDFFPGAFKQSDHKIKIISIIK